MILTRLSVLLIFIFYSLTGLGQTRQENLNWVRSKLCKYFKYSPYGITEYYGISVLYDKKKKSTDSLTLTTNTYPDKYFEFRIDKIIGHNYDKDEQELILFTLGNSVYEKKIGDDFRFTNLIRLKIYNWEVEPDLFKRLMTALFDLEAFNKSDMPKEAY